MKPQVFAQNQWHAWPKVLYTEPFFLLLSTCFYFLLFPAFASLLPRLLLCCYVHYRRPGLSGRLEGAWPAPVLEDLTLSGALPRTSVMTIPRSLSSSDLFCCKLRYPPATHGSCVHRHFKYSTSNAEVSPFSPRP